MTPQKQFVSNLPTQICRYLLVPFHVKWEELTAVLEEEIRVQELVLHHLATDTLRQREGSSYGGRPVTQLANTKSKLVSRQYHLLQVR